MRMYLLILLGLSTFSGFAQKMFENQESICPLKFIMEDEEQIIYYEPNDSIMVLDLLNGLEQKHIDKLKGVVMMQVMVDTIQQVCCVSYTNKTNLSEKKFDILVQLLKMNGWKRLKGVMPEENLCALVTVIFDKEDYVVMRTGYNRNKGKKQLSYEAFRRWPEVSKDSIRFNEN